MDKIVNIENIHQYNELMGVPTLHPLVSIVDFSKSKPINKADFGVDGRLRFNYGFYLLMLKDVRCGDLRYGRNTYDYQEGTIVCLAPGQVLEVVNPITGVQPKGWALAFHPDLIYGTTLGKNIRNYAYFSYAVNEALHLSEKERGVVMECLANIRTELNHDVDKHSVKLICRNIELLLDYCDRFYDRQFITRERQNKDVLTRFEALLDDYFSSELPADKGLPTVRYCADNMHLSPNYFGDLIKKETGKSAQEYIQIKVIDIAKNHIDDLKQNISEIAYGLGFKSPAHFSRLFRKCVGQTPSQYRLDGINA
jgi:AraC-like DNA-binding protein